MKKVTANLFLLLCFLVFAGGTAAQEKFDLVTFTAPKGWAKEVKPAAIQFATGDEAKGVFCLITMFKAVPSSADARQNFEISWEGIVNSTLEKVSAPEMQPTGNDNGWTYETGLGAYQNDGKKGAVMLVTATGGGKVINVLVLTNGEDYDAPVADFLESVNLPKVAPAAQSGNAPNAETAPNDSTRVIGRWQRSGSVHPKYGDAVSSGAAGYTKSRYEFKPDGSYIYTERTFAMSHSKIIVAKENGSYRISGDLLTIAPQRSVVEAYTKKDGADTLGALLSSEKQPLETITYQFTFHYFTGIKEWNFVLRADAPTKRDGAFSRNQTFPNAWYFDQKYIDSDLTAARID